MTQQGQYEYKLEIGAKSSEVDQIYLKSWKVSEGRDIDRFAIAEFKLIRTADSITVSVGDEVRYWRRVVGEASWGPTFFYGYVRKKPMKSVDNDIPLEACGYLHKVKSRVIGSAEWGNTHIVDKAYPAYVNATGNNLDRLYTNLDAGQPAQVPLERVRVCVLSEMVTAGWPTGTIQVFNPGGGPFQKVAQRFASRDSTLRRFWIKGYVNGAWAQNLVVDIQADNNGVPSGVNLTTFSIPSAWFPVGAGNETWIEVDLLNSVADPTKLLLWSGTAYWLIFSLANQDASIYDLRIANNNPQPNWRLLKVDAGAGYVVSPGNQCIFYALDFENDWTEMAYGYGRDYDVMGSCDPPVLLFLKMDFLVGDPPGVGRFMGRVFPVLYSGQNLIRVSYWKGKITYDTVLRQWAGLIASDIYDTLDISITEPSSKQFCIKVENADGLAAFRLLRQYAAICARIYMDAAGQVVFEIRDERLATAGAWALYTAAENARRTFAHGDDAGSQTEVRMIDMELSEELESESSCYIVRNEQGRALAIIGEEPLTSSEGLKTGGQGAKFNDAHDYGDPFTDNTYKVRKTGLVKLSGVDQSMATGPFRTTNELIKLTNMRLGINAQIFAVENVKWHGGDKKTTSLEIEFASSVFEHHVPSYHGMAPGKVDLLSLRGIFTMITEAVNPSDGRPGHFLQGKGATDTPTSLISTLGISGRAEEAILHKDPSIVYNDMYVWWIQLGTGVPAAGSLGAPVAEIPAEPVTIGPDTYLVAKVNPADLDLASTWPQEISEIGLRRSNDITKAGIIPISAYSLGVPDGTYDFFNQRPLMTPDKKILATIKVTAPAP